MIRFSTVIGGRDSSEVARDPRGFAVKLKTEDGNWDLVGVLVDGLDFSDAAGSWDRRGSAGHLTQCDSDYGRRVAEGLGLSDATSGNGASGDGRFASGARETAEPARP